MLREQVITPRNARSATTRNATKKQRPVTRGATRQSVSTTRRIASYLPLVAKLLFAVCAALFVIAAYRAAASAAFFEIRRVDVGGTARASARDIEAITRRVAGSAGVWNADIERVSAEVERLPWVRAAVVTRVLPTSLRVRVTEREPQAVVRLSESGRLAWVDTEGVMLGAVSPTDQTPVFFVRGWDETRSDAARRENRERIERYAEILRDWQAAGMASRISEVNLEDLRDVRAALAGEDSNIEVRLGGEDFGNRLRRALRVLDDERRTPRGALITRLDATVDRRVIVGFSSNAVTNAAPSESVGDGNREEATSNNRARERTTPRDAGRNTEETNARAGNERRRDDERTRRERARETNANRTRTNDTTRRSPATNERPRRAG